MAGVHELYQRLERDPWRTRFSEDIESVHRVILQQGVSDAAIEKAINGWLGEDQPCLFGKIAAKQNLLRVLHPDGPTFELLRTPRSNIHPGSPF